MILEFYNKDEQNPSAIMNLPGTTKLDFITRSNNSLTVTITVEGIFKETDEKTTIKEITGKLLVKTDNGNFLQCYTPSKESVDEKPSQDIVI